MDGLNILIVDDEPLVGDLIRRKLSKIEPLLNITLADSAYDCLELMAEIRVDCILSDYQMPGMDGMELLDRLRKSGDLTPFIFVTGQGNEEVAREAFKHGAYDYFTKEVGFAHFDRISNSIRQAVKHRRSEEDRARTEQKLTAEKNKLDAIIACIGDGLCIVNREFMLVYSNQAYNDLVGDHAGKHCYSIIEGLDRVCEDCPVERTFRDGRVHRSRKRGLIDGREIVVDISSSPLKDHSGGVVAAVKVVRDVTEQIKAAEQVASSEKMYRAMFEDMPLPMFIYEDVTFSFLAVNNTATDCYGYSEKEFLSLKATDIRPSEDEQAYISFVRNNPGRSGRSGIWRHKRKDGTVFHAEIVSQPIDFEGRSARVVLVNDVTERIQAERALKESEAVNSAIVGALPDLVFLLDGEGRFLDIKASNEDGLSVPREEAIQRHISDVLPGEVAGLALRHISEALDTGEVQVFEYQLEVPAGKRCFEARIAPLGIVDRVLGVVRDVTETKRTMEEVKRSREMLLSLIDGIPDRAWMKDENGRLLAVNKPFALACGLRPEDVVGKTDCELWPPRVAEYFISSDLHAISTGKAYRFEERLTGEDGTVSWFETVKAPYFDENGKVAGTIGIARNITDRKLMEEDLNRIAARFSEAESVAGLGSFEWLVEENAVTRSDGLHRIFGVRPGELSSSYDAYLNLVHPDDRERVIREDMDAMAGKPLEYITRIICPDGTQKTIHVQGSVSFSTGGKPLRLFSTVLDITKNTAIERALKDTEARYHTLMDNANDAILLADAKTGIVVDANRKAGELFGYGRDKIIGMHQSGLHPTEEVEKYTNIFKEHVERKEALSGDLLILRADGSTRAVEISASVVELGGRKYVQGIFRDITERRHSEEEKDRLLKGISAITEGIAFADRDGRYIYMNDAHAGLFGYRAEELIGKTWRQVIPPESRAATEEIMSTTLRDRNAGAIGGEGVGLRKDGSTVSVEFKLAGFFDKDGNFEGHVCIARDITERKAMQEELARSEERYKAAEDIARIGNWQWLIEKDEVIWSDGMFTIFGLDPADFGKTYRSYLDYVHPDDIERVMALVNESRTGTPLDYATRIICPDGQEKVIHVYGRLSYDASGKPARLFGTVQDITERTISDRALRASEERHRLIFETSAVGIVVADPQGNIYEANPAFCEMLGYPEGELIEMSVAQLTHDDDVDESKQQLSGLNEGTKDVIDIEMRYVQKGGGTIWARNTVTRHHVPGMPQQYNIAFIQDITGRKLLEKQREELFAMLRHDMKTPLAVISGNADMVISDYSAKLNAESLGMIESMKSSALLLTRMVDDLVAISRLESGDLALEKEPVDVTELLLEASVVASERSKTKGLIYERDVPGGLPEILANRSYVQRAVANLLDNAVKYTPKGGRVSLRAEVSGAGGLIAISVSDSGPGIAEYEREMVFEKHYRSPRTPSQSGSGLGLSIVKAVAGFHCGRVELDSREGEGSTFTLILPVDCGQ